jgi:RimJ/RimL family protein N-acetyltransferase
MRINSEGDAAQTIAEFEAAWIEGKAFFLGAFDRATGEFVCQIYIGVVNRDLPEFEVGFFVTAGREGQGYVAEAVDASLRFIFGVLGAHRVRLECDDTNVRSYRVAERCGFTREGHIRENRRWPDGSISGTFHYGMLKSEFPPRRTAS